MNNMLMKWVYLLKRYSHITEHGCSQRLWMKNSKQVNLQKSKIFFEGSSASKLAFASKIGFQQGALFADIDLPLSAISTRRVDCDDLLGCLQVMCARRNTMGLCPTLEKKQLLKLGAKLMFWIVSKRLVDYQLKVIIVQLRLHSVSFMDFYGGHLLSQHGLFALGHYMRVVLGLETCMNYVMLLQL